MSLEDKFYPEDGTALTAFDNRMIKLCGKVGEAYQWVTGRSYENLMRENYAMSALGVIAGAGIDAICAPQALAFTLPAAAVLGLACAFKITASETTTPLEEEIKYDLKGMPSKFGKVNRLAALVAGGLMATNVAVHHSLSAFTAETGHAVVFLSVLPYAFAEYLSLSHIPKPPEKHVFARAYDKIKALLEPQPALQPVPVPAQCMFSMYA